MNEGGGLVQWFYLLVAGLFEVIWAVGMKLSHGFSEVFPSIVTIIGTIASYLFLAMALKHLPLATTYAIWTGIGIVGTFFIGIYALHEPITILQGLCVVMIVIGIAGLRLLGH